MGSGLMGIEFQFYKMKRDLEISGGDDAPAMWMYLMSQNYAFKNGLNGQMYVMYSLIIGKWEVPVVTQWVKNATSTHEDSCSIPALVQWVKDWCSCKLQCRSQRGDRSGFAGEARPGQEFPPTASAPFKKKKKKKKRGRETLPQAVHFIHWKLVCLLMFSFSLRFFAILFYFILLDM